jgi:hypothetical protein
VASKILSAFAVAGLIYGILAAHPPLLFLFFSGLLGMAFAAINLWGERRKRTTLACCIAWGLFWMGKSVLERVFFGRPYDSSRMSWPAVCAEIAALTLGYALAFAFSLLWKSKVSAQTPAE